MIDIIITDAEIDYAEKVLGLTKGSFDNQRREAIKCIESRDIVACPGSGKTTVLLAKLIILANKMPFKDNRGICVLTHTNIAINEIKNKLGEKFNILLTYPNFVGTIQSFIDKYLAIPANVKYYGIRPCRILEKEEFDNKLVRCFREMYPDYRNSKLHGLLYSILNSEERRSWRYINKVKEEKLKSLRLDYLSGYLMMNKEGNEFPVVKDKDKPSYKEYFSLIEALMKQGIISYNEADGLALRYLTEFKELLQPLFNNRFAFVFIDEMQDTKSIQNEILSNIFDKNRVVYQCFGDPNQAIYSDMHDEGNWEPNDPMKIDNSMRFSNNIAKVSDCLAIEPYEMKGLNGSNISPTIITYNDDVSEVLERFAKLIIHYNLHKEKDPNFKAVGMVKDKDNGLCIKRYFSSFNKMHNKNNIYKDYHSLSDYLIKLDPDIVKKNGVRVYYNRFINAMLKILRLMDCKTENSRYYTKTSLLKFLKDSHLDYYDEMNLSFTEWIIKLEGNENIENEFIDFTNRLLNDVFNTSPNELVNEFYINRSDEMLEDTSVNNEVNNVFHYEGVNIELDTVHGVKGESHTATLYLETKHYQDSISYIIDYLNGDRETEIIPLRSKHLKIAYVAMTRPKELLCITMKEDVYESNKEKLEAMGWVKYNL